MPLIRNGVEEVVYISFVYEPIKDAQGTFSKVMILAIDVTSQVLSRRILKKPKTGATFYQCIAVGTFEVDLLTNTIIASPRMDEIFESERTNRTQAGFVSAIHPDDLPGRTQHIKSLPDRLLEYRRPGDSERRTLRWVRSGKNFL